MQEKWLPGNTMDRIRDLCRSRNITQVELAQAVGMDKSTLSRVMAEKTSKLSSKNLVAIANYFEVSTDFLLGLTDIPSRKEYDIERLGLSVEAAANLHQGKLNRSVVCQLLENPKFAELTRQIALYQEGVLASGVAAQNQMYNSCWNMVRLTRRICPPFVALCRKRRRSNARSMRMRSRTSRATSVSFSLK